MSNVTPIRPKTKTDPKAHDRALREALLGLAPTVRRLLKQIDEVLALRKGGAA